MPVRRRRSPLLGPQGSEDAAVCPTPAAEGGQQTGDHSVTIRGRGGNTSRQWAASDQHDHEQSHGDSSVSRPDPQLVTEPLRGFPDSAPATHATGTTICPSPRDAASTDRGNPATSSTSMLSGGGTAAAGSSSTILRLAAPTDPATPRPRPPSILPSRLGGRDGGTSAAASSCSGSASVGGIAARVSPPPTPSGPPPPPPLPPQRFIRHGDGAASANGRGVASRGGATSRRVNSVSDTTNNNEPGENSESEQLAVVAGAGSALHGRRGLVQQTQQAQEQRESPAATPAPSRPLAASREQDPRTRRIAASGSAASAPAGSAVGTSGSHNAAGPSGRSRPSRFFGDNSPSTENNTGARARNMVAGSSGGGGGSTNAGGGRGSYTGSGAAAATGAGGRDAGVAVAAGSSVSVPSAANSVASGGSRPGPSTTINQLHKASVVGDLTSISRFIQDGGNLEAQSFCGRTALHYAAFYGHADVARALILAGANVCSRGGGNSTPLHFAAWGGNKKVVRLLLDYGADVEARDTEGNAAQAYSEDDELYAMLVQARRKTFPVPTNFLARTVEAHPAICLGFYITGVVLITEVAVVVLLVAIMSNPAARGIVGFTTHTTLRNGAGKGGGKAAAAAAAAAAAGSWKYMGSLRAILDFPIVPLLGILLPIGLILVAGFTPAVVATVGYKRRTKAFWSSIKARDEEIVRLRHREQAAGGWIPPNGLHSAAGAASASPGGVISAGHGAASSPRAISRGEQAGQAVIARLTRLQAAAAAAGASGAGGGEGGAGAGGVDRGGQGVQREGFHHQIIHQHQVVHRQYLELRQLRQAVDASGALSRSLGLGGGGGETSRSVPCVQVAQ